MLWSFALQKDWIGGSVSCGVLLVHYGVLAVGSPHPSASRPPSPSGKALPTRYKLAVLYFLMINGTTQSFPLGGKVGRLKPGRMRATLRKESVVYQSDPAPRGTTNQIHLAQPDTILRLLVPHIHQTKPAGGDGFSGAFAVLRD